ncbi:site-specific integrase [Dasania sp. GY-MA-18]|uniref:Site-specific integrase n=1 Tax=Dasania phycosphaerae TaxID=2950436 RepID=A0A9J6RLA6_9GAMM|nr:MULTISPECIES: site-specific integrase [Dasania]MCR8922683.1 site-specific integrase [Dasania sp. GY-MA-18]MCZ0865113.1 site-specific integrase [Dasania phycosphaerae]MCZ0868839.1 site-specific integrase [Dasania phycosphaerae]
MNDQLSKDYFCTYFTVEEEKTLLRVSKALSADIFADRDHWWMLLLRHTGMRVSVLANLTVGWAKESLRVGYYSLDPEHNKRKKTQPILVTKKVAKALRELLRVNKAMSQWVDWSDTPLADRPLILSRKHQGISVRNLQDRMAYWCRVAGFNFTGSPHWWRHTWAKRQLANCEGDQLVTLRRIKAHLQHKSIATTEVYVKPDREEMENFWLHMA